MKGIAYFIGTVSQAAGYGQSLLVGVAKYAVLEYGKFIYVMAITSV